MFLCCYALCEFTNPVINVQCQPIKLEIITIEGIVAASRIFKRAMQRQLDEVHFVPPCRTQCNNLKKNSFFNQTLISHSLTQMKLKMFAG